MTDTNGHSEKKRTLPVEWPEEQVVEIPLQVRPLAEPIHVVKAPLLHRPDTTPPFRQTS